MKRALVNVFVALTIAALCGCALSKRQNPTVSASVHFEGIQEAPRNRETLNHYNSIPVYESVLERMKTLDMQTIVATIGQVFRKHKVDDILGLFLLHRHFDIGANEHVVEVIDGAQAISRVYSTDSANIKNSTVLPHVFQVETDGLLVPLEYSVVNEHNPHLENRVNTLKTLQVGNSTFFDDFVRVCTHLKVLDLFGVGVRHREAVVQEDSTGSTMETSDAENRYLKVVPFSHLSAHELTDLNSSVSDGLVSNTFWVFDRKRPFRGSAETNGRLPAWLVPENYCKHSCKHQVCGGHDKRHSIPVVMKKNWCAHSCRHSCSGHKG